ncbi:right-handed parallel beta-helix repeat-containing protein [Sorangium sp. So ce233]|uniref:right-handed parallel beta-helix repeat-containing protein n=1 Tax=Sorangium sp. So ce233 TaxID=3133290 RepID=UPI003F5F2688
MSELPHGDACCRRIPITARDINGGPAPDRRAPFVITAPGQYALVEDVDWVASDADARAITIASDDVTLDLCGRTLRQVHHPAPRTVADPGARPCRGEVVSGNVGVHVEGRRRIVIKNGSVVGIQGVGIVARDCRQLDLRDLSVRRCGGDGVIDTSFLCRNGGIFVMGTQHTQDASNDITFASDVRMLNCVCSENTSRLDAVVTLGALVLFCDNVEVKQCVFNHNANTSAQPSGVQFNVVGVDFVICRNVLVEDCEAHDNTSGGEPAGFFAWGENYKFLRCRANRNHTLTGNRACGFNISTTSNLEMIACEADGNYNANPGASADGIRDFSALGFRIGRAVYRALIEDCRAIGNHSVGVNAPAGGFALHSTRQVVLRRCAAVGNRNASGTAENDGLAAGFIASAPLADPEGGVVGGEDNAFIDCIADGNTVHRAPLFVQPPAPPVDAGPSRGDPRKGAGFLLAGQKDARIIGCQAANNDGKGIWLRACARALVEGNTLSRNTLYGIENEAPAGLSAFTGNRAHLNGARHRHNYVGLPAGTPVRKWTLGSRPLPGPSGALDNLSIRLP